MNAAEKIGHVTLEEFETMAKDERFNYELIDGVVMMSPSPSREHQRIGFRLACKLGDVLSNTLCEALYEYDIRFENDIFQPDMMIFCSPEAAIPEIIFEILSPSNRYIDLHLKFIRYKEMGIKEYWIIDPKFKNITVHDFVNHTSESYGAGDTIQSQTIPEIVIAVTDIFA